MKNFIATFFKCYHLQVPLSSASSSTQNSNGKQLIDNLVGNWVPNESGTYSPFGGSSNITSLPQSPSALQELAEQQKNFVETQQKKPRMVAEVKPMRPSYSDVLIKSVPTPSPTIVSSNVKHENSTKKLIAKSLKNKPKTVILKCQNSSGSDEHGSPKLVLPTKSTQPFSSNLSRRWVSLDDISSSSESPDLTFDRSNNFERKKSFKFLKKETDKGETLNNYNIQNNSIKIETNSQKRPIQINNNLNTITRYSQTTYVGNKIEKNKQTNNKVKEEKKIAKDRYLKHFQAEKIQQIKKNQKNRKKENKDSAFRDLFKTVHKYSNRWSKIGLKILLWLLHLISDVFSMSINLVVQL